jgi:hypothetical protein
MPYLVMDGWWFDLLFVLEEGSTRMRAPVGKRCSADLFVHLDSSTFFI